ncbi:transcription repressor OFP14 [Ricinus communis]|uniref:Transcription repressor n=1 Tax=Ricinus communis TaxID=3988 RepID=B9SQD2_RICCO|nr:transcription repressor OFP14 [Ricinus communis]EEF34208.1 conserved hypothetical protein [Ricinus communis]|eukprot:XP_002528201.1 transcription repressor OFP14 [Ricinus communis]
MPTKLKKSLQEYLSKVKNPKNPSRKWILSGCKHPKTPSFAFDRSRDNDDHDHRDGPAATLSDIDRFLLENFKSLYIKNDDEDHNSHQKNKVEGHREDGQESEDYRHQVPSPAGGILFDSPRFVEPPPHLCGSHRFFVAAASSSSLIEEARLSLTTTTITTTSTSDEGGSRSTSTRSSSNINTDYIKNVNTKFSDDYIAVKTYSRSPSNDFRRSMQEMVEARLQEDGKVNWDFMQELLFCYLNLNEKKSHKFILSAFVDLIVGLRQRSDDVPARPRRNSSRRERKRKLRNVT